MANGEGLGRCQLIAGGAQQKKQHIDLWYYFFGNNVNVCKVYLNDLEKAYLFFVLNKNPVSALTEVSYLFKRSYLQRRR